MSHPTCCCSASLDRCDRCDLLVGLEGFHLMSVARTPQLLVLDVESCNQLVGPGACQFFCVWGLEVGGDSVGVGGGELGEGLFPVGGGASLDEACGGCSFVGGFAGVCEALGGSFVFDVADGEP